MPRRTPPRRTPAPRPGDPSPPPAPTPAPAAPGSEAAGRAAPALDALRALPAAVERWWAARAHAPVPGSTEVEALRRLAPEVQRLSDAFTCARPAAYGDYAQRPEALTAYGLWYFPQSWVRTRLPLAEAALVRGLALPTDRPLRVLDVGAGTGAAGLAAATWLATGPVERAAPVELVALDHAPAALEALERLSAEALPPAARPRVTCVRADARDPARWPAAAQGPFDLVLASFVLNELFPSAVGTRPDPAVCAWLGALAERLGPEGLLLVLEPATKPEAVRTFARAADLVEQHGLHGWGPQLGPGAWRPPADRRTWPHEARRWTPPASLAVVNRTLWRSAGELTFSYALLGRRAPPPLPEALDGRGALTWVRAASPVRVLKGRRTWLAYGVPGRLLELEVQERDLDDTTGARLRRLERGDVLALERLAPLGRPDAYRLPDGSALLRHLSPR